MNMTIGLKKSTRINENFLYNDIKDKIWKDQKLINKNILLVREQGVGDEILYSSMYEELTKINCKLIIETDPRLIKIFKRSINFKNFIPENKVSQNKSKLKKIDLIMFAGSLGRIFRNKINDFPKKNKYLQPDLNLCKKNKN